MTIQAVLQLARIKNAANLDAELILADVIGKKREYLISHSEDILTLSQADQFQNLWNQRLQGRPLAYIIGKKEFFALEFEVSPDCLIPRPETELLVERALERINDKFRVLDLGTGSGCIAISIAKHRPNIGIWASDISDAALRVAQQNAKKHLVAEQIFFKRSDLLEEFYEQNFDLLVANLPYVPDLEPIDVSITFEPKIALFGGFDGLEVYRRFLKQLKSRKRPFVLIMEIGYGQSEAVKKLFDDYLIDFSVKIHDDLCGVPRVIEAEFLLK